LSCLVHQGPLPALVSLGYYMQVAQLEVGMDWTCTYPSLGYYIQDPLFLIN
jgi:hypothetical protein